MPRSLRQNAWLGQRGRTSLANLLDNLPVATPDEVFEDLLSRPGVRIERIVSNGQSTPMETPFCQDHDEWVLLLRGAASLMMDGEGTRDLRPGDHVLIPAGCRHWVTRTATDQSTVWLAVHFGG
jgi:cupin 2 domain-containing protein